MKKSFWALIAALTAAAAFLRFALRGYAWWGYLCLFIAALLLAHRFLPAVLWRIVVLLTCLGLAYFCFVEYFIIKNARTDADAGRDYLIVLGAAVHGEKVTWVLSNRLDAAYDYAVEHPDTVLVVSGGQGDGESVTEASAMAKYLIARGVDPARVLLEERAESTAENFAFSKAVIDRQLGPDASIGFVTTRFHVYRAARVAQKGGIDARGLGAPDVWYIALNNFLRECVGICWYTVKGWI